MFIVGLTGGIATGKSTVLAIFRAHEVAVIDADDVAKKVLEPRSQAWIEVLEYFGPIVLLPNGKINRAKLAELVFNNAENRKKLNAITHPKIQTIMIKMALTYFFTGHSYIVIEVPLLFETGKLMCFMHKIITVVCEDHQQLERLCRRNNLTVNSAKRRISSQMPLELKVARSDFVVDNSGDLLNTIDQTERIIKVFRKSNYTCYFRSLLAVAVISVAYGVRHAFGYFFGKNKT